MLLVYRTVAGSRGGKRLLGLQINSPEGLLILRQVLSQQIPESLGLLRTDIDSLKVSQDDFVGGILAGGAKHQHKVPYTGPYLNAVGIAVAIVLRLNDVDIWRRIRGLAHATRVSRVHGCGLHQTIGNFLWNKIGLEHGCLLLVFGDRRMQGVLESILGLEQLSPPTRVTIATSRLVELLALFVRILEGSLPSVREKT